MNQALSSWTFLSNHAHVLILLGREPDLRMRDIAEQVGITERAVQRIIAELAHEGYLEVIKEGRRNHYRVRRDRELRHPVEAGVKVEALLDLVER
jgi:DNA-binding MarR family transcriptional regulator